MNQQDNIKDQTPGGVSTSPSADKSVVAPLWLIVCISLCTSLGAAYLAWSFPRVSGNTPQIVMIDAGKLLIAEEKLINSTPGVTPQKAAVMGKDFALRLDQVLKPFTDQGFVVVNSNVIINNPASLNVTAQVASALNLKIE